MEVLVAIQTVISHKWQQLTLDLDFDTMEFTIERINNDQI